jgi:hypothetical protein
MITACEYRFTSPSFFHDRAGRITRLKGAGLVHALALHLHALAQDQASLCQSDAASFDDFLSRSPPACASLSRPLISGAYANGTAGASATACAKEAAICAMLGVTPERLAKGDRFQFPSVGRATGGLGQAALVTPDLSGRFAAGLPFAAGHPDTVLLHIGPAMNSPDHIPRPTEMPRPTAQAEHYVAALGMDKAMIFLLLFGGAELYLGGSPRDNSEYIQDIRPDGAAALFALAHRLQRRVPLDSD